MKKILITGGFGFLGGRIAEFLSANDFKVYLGSSKPRQKPNWLQNSEIVFMDWNSIMELEKVTEGIDVVVHCAGMNARDCENNPIKAFEFNTVATGKLLEACRQKKVKSFIYFSTAHVYDSPLIGNIDEEYLPRNKHPYATSHLSAEYLVGYYGTKYNISHYIFRLSNAFGQPAHKDVDCWSLVVNDLCRQAVQKRKLTLKTSGMQHRDFVPISYVCSAVEFFINDLAKVQSGIYNLGSGKSLSILEMANLIQDRSRKFLGYIPDLERVMITVSGDGNPFNFDVQKLLATKLNGRERFDFEIDRLLDFCKLNYRLER